MGWVNVLTMFLVFIVAALALAPLAAAQSEAQDQLAQFDATFVCPDKLPTFEAHNEALKRFIEVTSAIRPAMTDLEVTNFRLALLHRHHCDKTIRKMRQLQHDDARSRPTG